MKAGIISSSNDLAGIYGLLEIKNSNSREVSKYNYMRVWKKTIGNWKIAVDVADKFSE